LLDGLHEALVEAFRIPDDDRTQRIDEYPSEDFEIPPGRSEKYMLVEITAFPGRSFEAKRNLYRAITRKLVALGVPALDILIVLNEPALENWGVRGGFAASEVDIGFDIQV
jgi:phenylpyruvate tautomerase PptA (4-oxalocrotonate tautomerase family)